MAGQLELWRFEAGSGLQAVTPRSFELEEVLEDLVERQPDLLGEHLLILARQPRTDTNKLLDLLAIDGHGRMVVIENKKDQATGDVVGQALDYAAWVHGLTLYEVSLIFSQYSHGRGAETVELSEAYEYRFGKPLDRIAVSSPRILIVATAMDDQLAASIRFLSTTHAMDIDAVLLQPFEGGLLARTDGWTPHRPSEADALTFWTAWIPLARTKLDPFVRLNSGATGATMTKSLIQGVPGNLVVSLQSKTARVAVELSQTKDDDLHVVMMHLLMEQRADIERRFGGALDWPTETKKSLKISTNPTAIGSPSDPTAVGLDQVARTARDLVAAVMPHLAGAHGKARRALANSPAREPNESTWPVSATIDLRGRSSIQP